MTFLAVRRWFGWSAGRLLVLDIGGGSLEIAAGIDEEPEVALSLPLGAGRLTRERLSADPPPAVEVEELREYVDRQLAGVDGRRLGPGGRDLEDVPDPGPAGRCRPVERPASAPRAR